MPNLHQTIINPPVANAAALTAVEVTNFNTNILCEVITGASTNNALYVYAKTSTATVDGDLVINGNGGVGRWLKICSPDGVDLVTDVSFPPANDSATRAASGSLAVWLKNLYDAAGQTITSQVDFTTSEPASPAKFDSYLNTGTGTSSGTGQSVTAGNVYTWDGAAWVSRTGAAGNRIWDDALGYNLMRDNTAFTTQADVYYATLSDAANIAWNVEGRHVASVTLAGNRTLDNPTNLVTGMFYTLIVKQDATGSRTLAYDTLFKFPSGITPVLSTAANAVDVLTFLYDGTNLLGNFSKGFA